MTNKEGDTVFWVILDEVNIILLPMSGPLTKILQSFLRI